MFFIVLQIMNLHNKYILRCEINVDIVQNVFVLKRKRISIIGNNRLSTESVSQNINKPYANMYIVQIGTSHGVISKEIV